MYFSMSLQSSSKTASPFSPLYTLPSWTVATSFWVKQGDTDESKGVLLDLIGSQYLAVISLRIKAIAKRNENIEKQLSRFATHFSIHNPYTENPPFKPIFSQSNWTSETKYWLLYGDMCTPEDRALLLDTIANYLERISLLQHLNGVLVLKNEVQVAMIKRRMTPASIKRINIELQQASLRELTHFEDTALPFRPFSKDMWVEETKHWVHSDHPNSHQDRVELLGIIGKCLRLIGLRECLLDDMISNHETKLHIFEKYLGARPHGGEYHPFGFDNL